MLTQELFVSSVLISIPFLAAFWLMVFLNTYRHFPKMAHKERVWLSIQNATFPTFALAAIIFIALWLALQKI